MSETDSSDDSFLAGTRAVAFGGGSGLGRVLAALRPMGNRLTGIVATTDDGGSTGWIREQSGGIAWGDVRNCLNQVVDQHTLGSVLFEYRFHEVGDLSGHSLGNLILLALDQISPRPLHAIELVRELLHVQVRLMPMAEQPARLHALSQWGEEVAGEVKVDSLEEPPSRVWVEPRVEATPEAVQAIRDADLVTIGPGSFITSVLPSLLVDELREAVAESKALKVLIANRQPEAGPMQHVAFHEQIRWMESVLGVHLVDVVLWPEDRELPDDGTDDLHIADVSTTDGRRWHDPDKLRQAMLEVADKFMTR